MKKKILIGIFTTLLLLNCSPVLSAQGNDSPYNKAGNLVEETRIDEETSEEIIVVGQIIDSTGELRLLKKGDLILTPYSSIDEVEDEEIKAMLIESKKELVDDNPNLLKICPTLKDKLKETETLTSSNITIAEIYNVKLKDEEAKAMLENDGDKLRFKMYVDFDEDEEFIVIAKNRDGNWVVVDDVEYVVDKNGNYLCFTFDTDGCLALIRRGNDKMCNCLLSINGYCLCWVFVVLSIGELAYIIYLRKKNKKENKDETLDEVKEKATEEVKVATKKKTTSRKTTSK